LSEPADAVEKLEWPTTLPDRVLAVFGELERQGDRLELTPWPALSSANGPPVFSPFLMLWREWGAYAS